jgi:hypothetical protein
VLSITVRWTIVPLGLPNSNRLRLSRPVSICGVALHLLYLDESGHSHDPSTDFFVLAGFAIFERQTHWLESNINPVAARFNAAHPASIEFHGSPMFSGKKEWEGVAPADRVQAVDKLQYTGDHMRNTQTDFRVAFARMADQAIVTLVSKPIVEDLIVEIAPLHGARRVVRFQAHVLGVANISGLCGWSVPRCSPPAYRNC